MSAVVRRVELEHGVIIEAFWDPPGETQRWRVRLPRWFPTGSWLSYPHAYASVESAMEALEETGALAAIDDLWRANSEARRARNKAFSAVMAAHNRGDRGYADLVRARALDRRATVEP